MAVLFQEKVQKSFVDKVVVLANETPDITPNCGMFVMNNESALSSSIVNSIGCAGLIQFCPDRAGLDYKTIGGVQYKLVDIANMSPERQLELVFQYWADIRKTYGRYATCDDLYLATFYPYAIGQPDSYILGSERSMSYAQLVAQQNPMFNIDKNGVITKGEFKQWMKSEVYKKVPIAYYDDFFKKKTSFSYINVTLYSGAEFRLAS